MPARAVHNLPSRWIVLILAPLVLLSVAMVARSAGLAMVPFHGFLAQWGGLVLEAAAAAVCVGRAVLVPRERLAWALLATGMTLWTLGDGYWRGALFHLDQVPLPSAADFLWLSFYPFSCGAIAALIRSRTRGAALSVWIDALIGAFAVAALSTAFVVASVANSELGGTAATIVGLAYPVADGMLLVLVIGALAITRDELDRTWVWLAAGLATFAISDSIYLHQLAEGSYTSGGILDLGWVLGFFLIAAAACCKPSERPPTDSHSWHSWSIPVAGVGVATAILQLDDIIGAGLPAQLMATACLLCVMLRLALTFRQNHRVLMEVGDQVRRADASFAEAERANHAKSEFLSRMSHELRTPLNSILGFGQLLAMEDLDDDSRDSVGHILTGGHHLLGLINEVLDISRIESGRFSVSLEPVSATALVAGAIDMIRPLAATRRIDLQNALAVCPETWVLADQQRLRQVLLNLLSNAVKYNREGGTVTVTCETTAHGRVRIVVADTGNGLTGDQLERVFSPFERLGAEHSIIEGTGLGLALSTRLAQAMGGTLEVGSEVGTGSWFAVVLAEAQSPSATGASPAVTADPHAGWSQVLYVEDNVANLSLVESVLTRRPNLELSATVGGLHALELARAHLPALIILDLHLPDLSGAEVLARLKADPITAAIPVVVLTADASSGLAARMLAAGAVAFLPKPIDVPMFLAAVDGALALESPVAA
jgi:signal transduction histidine kinase/ActR/RegA family two-component response regulator